MKRTLAAIGSLAIAGAMLTLGTSAATAADDLVTVCHVTGAANSPDSNNTYTWSVGHEIQVSAAALPAFERRGDGIESSFDSSHYIDSQHTWWKTMADVDGSLVNADCAFR